MVEKLPTPPELNRNNAKARNSHGTKAMSESGAVPHDNEAHEGESAESESGTQAESNDENDQQNAKDSALQHQTSVPLSTNNHTTPPSSLEGPQSKDKSDHSAKQDADRTIPTGSSSESSIKTTPDSSLESTSNCESEKQSQKEEFNNNVEAAANETVTTTTKDGRDLSKLSQQSVSRSNSSSTNEPRSQNHSSSAGSRKKNGASPPPSIDSGPLNIRALPFESGVNTECIQLLRQLWNVHDEALSFLNCVHSTLCTFRRYIRIADNEYEDSLWDKKRLSSCSTTQMSQRRAFSGKSESEPGNDGESQNDIRWVPLQEFVHGLKCVSDNISDIEKQCLALSVFQSQCKLVLYAKIRHAKRQVTHDRLAILHGVHQLVNVATQLLASPFFWVLSEKDVIATYACSICQLAETYNTCLESCWSHVEASLAAANPSLASTPSDADSGNEMGATTSTSKIRILAQVKAANTNDAPLLKQSLKSFTATKLLQVIAQRRASFAACDFTRTTLTTFYERPADKFRMEKFSQYVDDENKHLHPLEKAFSTRPSILGRAAVKECENGELRLTKNFRLKMYGYFHEVLWSLVGEYAEDYILWNLQTALPLTLQPSDMQIQLRQVMMSTTHAQVDNPSPLLPALEAIGGALHSFSLLVNWDEKMRSAFEIAFKVKRPEHVSLVSKPQPSQWATEVGTKFGDIVFSSVALMESGNSVANRMSLPLPERQKLATIFAEEEPLGDEAQILFRLEATLNYFRAWTNRRAKVWLNSWAVSQFISCSQREPAILVQMLKSKEAFLLTREIFLKNENIAIRISARNRQMCADDVKTSLLNLQKLPDELLHSVGIVCRTLSLATLQTYMPGPNHWKGVGKGSGLDPDKPSPYVRIFIERVVEPVFKAAVNLVAPLVQEALGKQVINAMCDAWLHYILQKKIKFSEWGAVQLLRDFVSLREWIRSETQLDKEAKKAILQLEILKSCEGVAYLLLRNPGDVLGVGKPSRKSRRVAPASGGSVESSPTASEASAVEDDIPPEMYVPNQQMWLQLRLKKTGFSSCCNL